MATKTRRRVAAPKTASALVRIEKARDMGHMSIIVSIMRANNSSPEVLRLGCDALASLTCKYQQKTAVMKTGGLAVVLAAMRRSSSNKSYNSDALDILYPPLALV